MSLVLILDTETTGVDADRQPIEISHVRVNRDEDPERIHPLTHSDVFTHRYKPSVPISHGAMAVHHILPSDLEDCPPPSDFRLPEGVTAICGHSIDFDWETIGKPEVKRICTLALSRRLWPDFDSHKLTALIYRLEGAVDSSRQAVAGAHRSLDDCMLTALLLGHILRAKPEITTWTDLHAFSEEARIPTHMPMGRNKGQPITSLEDGEMQWYLDRGVGDEYMHKAFRAELERRYNARVAAGEDDEEFDDEF